MIIVLFADGFEEIEALMPVDILRRGGLDVKTVGINGKTVVGSHDIKLICDAEASEINPDDVTMAIFPGGMPGATNLDGSEFTDKIISSVISNGGRLAAICAAPLVLGRRGLLEGKRATCYPGFEQELRGAILSKDGVVTDGNITTAKGMGVALEFAEELAALCLGKEKAEKISKGIYRPKKNQPKKWLDSVFEEFEEAGKESSGKAVSFKPLAGVDFSDYRLPSPSVVCSDGGDPTDFGKIVESGEFKASESVTTACLGLDAEGKPVVADVARMPHAIIGGMVESGKSALLNSVIAGMLIKAKPQNLRFIFIDTKNWDLAQFDGIPHLISPSITKPNRAAGALMWAIEEMERRYELLTSLSVRNVDAYNQKVKADPSLGVELPKIVIVIDDLADLIRDVKDEVEMPIMRLAQKARASGIYMLISTSRPSTEVITGLIKANIPTRIAFKTASDVESRTLLDARGAEQLERKGEALYLPVSSVSPTKITGAFISDKEIDAIIDAVNANGQCMGYDSDFNNYVNNKVTEAKVKSANKKAAEPKSEGGYLNDKSFLEAVELAVMNRKVSTSLLQRKLGIGYGKAAKYIDFMEELGIVSEFDGYKPRSALISMEEWQEKLVRVGVKKD